MLRPQFRKLIVNIGLSSEQNVKSLNASEAHEVQELYDIANRVDIQQKRAKARNLLTLLCVIYGLPVKVYPNPDKKKKMNQDLNNWDDDEDDEVNNEVPMEDGTQIVRESNMSADRLPSMLHISRSRQHSHWQQDSLNLFNQIPVVQENPKLEEVNSGEGSDLEDKKNSKRDESTEEEQNILRVGFFASN